MQQSLWQGFAHWTKCSNIFLQTGKEKKLKEEKIFFITDMNHQQMPVTK